MLVANRIIAIVLTVLSAAAFVFGQIDKATYLLLYVIMLDLDFRSHK